MKQARLLLVLLAAALVALSGCATRGPALCVLHTNDLHGHIAPARVPGWRERRGGAAVLAGCAREIRAENERAGVPTLLLDAGDIFMGAPEGTMSRGRAVVETMNAAGYDAMAVGNHEFDHGVGVLEDLAAAAAFPILGANVRGPDGGVPPFLAPHVVVRFDDISVGLAGVITAQTPAIVMPGRVGAIEFGDPAEAARRAVAELEREGVSFIILISHCGVSEDVRIAREVDGIGLIVGGHSHDLLERPLRAGRAGTLIVQAGDSGRHLGRLDLRIDPRRRRARRHRYGLIPITEDRCPPDPEAAAVVEKWRARAREEFGEAVGVSLDDFEGGGETESELGNMIADGMRETARAEIAFHNAYGIRNPLLAGPVTVADIYAIMPFDNTIHTMRLQGRQVRRVLEQSLGLRDGLLQVSGLTVVYDPGAPAGGRVRSAECGGGPLDDNRLYTVATNSYLAAGGDNFTVFAEGLDPVDTGILDRDSFAAYIRSRSPVGPSAGGPARLIPRPGPSAAP
ncbi:MAG: bifunctional UDP-sugar hydrolase/5'-nucleotidase [bacterium]|nr:bifunctional UDP-sugar hydrolase/5'-nucleotidase [bacterium]